MNPNSSAPATNQRSEAGNVDVDASSEYKCTAMKLVDCAKIKLKIQ